MPVNLRRSRLWSVLAVLVAVAVVVAVSWMMVRMSGGAGGRIATLLPKAAQPTQVGWKVHNSAVAGNGSAGAQEGMGIAARFSDPYGIALDKAGVLYVADAGENNRIRRIAPDGSVSTLAGAREGFADGIGAAAAFHTPSALALDRAGNLYVADTGNNAIRKVTPQGVVSTLAGGGAAGERDGPGATAQFNGPVGVAVDRHGNVLVADTYNDRIRRIAPDGSVTTLAGGAPGAQDGPAKEAQFDTPTAIVVDAQDNVYVADSGNGAVRRIGADGMVTTWASAQDVGAAAPASDVQLRRPVALALTYDGYLYVGDMARGRIWQIGPDGVRHGLTGVGIDIQIGDARTPRLVRPTGLAVAPDGTLYVADSMGKQVRRLGAQPPLQQPVQQAAIQAAVQPASHAASAPVAQAVTPAVAQATPASFPWPVAPQNAWHEVVGIVGECRGSYSGESRDHFHNGLDVQAPMGTPVLAVAAEKVSSPVPNWGYGDTSEGLSVEAMTYLHMRVGRDVRDRPLDTERFSFVMGEKGKPVRVRVKRGTRFAVGDRLGTVNRMFHVHLVHRVPGGESNPIALPLPGLADTIAPRIDSIFLAGPDGQRLTRKRANRVLVAAAGGPLALVVEAWDQMDGNEARRKLGLYKLGYQVLRADGTPLPGFEQPRVNIEFNRLPPDQESVKVAYAENSGITVYGSARTRFLYVATNLVRDGRAEPGSLDPAQLAPGDYLIRVLAADYMGNTAMSGRDLPITVE
ncbi:MAG: gluconolaconase [Gammaproteobacteria bacterium]